MRRMMILHRFDFERVLLVYKFERSSSCGRSMGVYSNTKGCLILRTQNTTDKNDDKVSKRSSEDQSLKTRSPISLVFDW